MMKKLFRGIFLAVSCCTLFSISAAADSEKNFITPDGVLSLELPDDSWQHIPDVETWVTLSNGSDVITVYHLSNGETLPPMVVADITYTNVCQMILSSRNEVFVITGSARNESGFEDVREAVESAEILKKDTKLAVEKERSDTAAVGSTKELYYANGNTVIITRYSDGSWKDDGGLVYTTSSEDGSVWTNSEGSRLTIYDPWEAGELPQANEAVRYLVNTETGKTVTVYETMEGDWIDKAAVKYFLREDGLWMDPSGGEWAEQ